jgi:hypothetical protein
LTTFEAIILRGI